MRRRAFLLAMTGVCAQDTPVFRARVNEVRVDCEVTDGIRTITGLGPADFVVFDNGQPQQILHVSQDQEPLDIVLLFDVSGSMKPAVQRVAAAARAAFAHLRPGDHVAVALFSARTRVLLHFTDNLDEVRDVVEHRVAGSRFGGGTRLLGAIDDAGRTVAMQPRSQRRRAVLVVTDNEGNPSRLNQDAIIERLWEADASINGLIVRPAGWQRRQVLRWALSPHGMALGKAMATHMDTITDKTGGALVKAEDPGTDFANLMERIRRRYSVYYLMPESQPGDRRNVRIELTEEARKNHKSARVRARKGYVVPGSVV